MTPPHGEEKEFARVGETENRGFKFYVLIDSARISEFFPGREPARVMAQHINDAFSSRVRPLVEALEKIGRSCPDTISRLWAQKALEDFRNGK